jgi:hypothetical protein
MMILGIAAAGDSRAQKKEFSLELAKLRQQRAELAPSEANKSFDDQLNEIEKDLSVNFNHSALYKLQNAWTSIAALHFYEKQSAFVKDKEPLLEAEWKKAGRNLAIQERKFTAPALNRLPAAVKAVAQAAILRSRPFYQSSILYGANTSPNQGLYYIGLAKANVDLAAFCLAQNHLPKKTALTYAPLDAELSEIEKAVINSYRKSAETEQGRYINLNSTLKLAGELNKAGWREAALMKYLDAVILFYLITAPPPPPEKDETAAAQERLKEMSAKLSARKDDCSIGLMFLELAQSYLNNADDDKISTNNLKRVAAIEKEVMPRFFEYIAGAEK